MCYKKKKDQTIYRKNTVKDRHQTIKTNYY